MENYRSDVGGNPPNGKGLRKSGKTRQLVCTVCGKLSPGKGNYGWTCPVHGAEQVIVVSWKYQELLRKLTSDKQRCEVVYQMLLQRGGILNLQSLSSRVKVNAKRIGLR